MKRKIRYREKQPQTMLTPTGGFLSGYTHTLNPYGGCVYACAYCYVRRLPVAMLQGEPWGSWVDVKRFDPDRFRRELARAKSKGPVTIFLSSATDPYQPAEYRLGLTRELLRLLAENPPAFLFLQTRSPLVTRDIDILRRFPAGGLRVSVTIETDREDVRRALTPNAPPVAARLRALRELAEAGLATQAAVAPLLPCTPAFPDALAKATRRVTIDTFALGDGAQGRRTDALGIREKLAELGEEEWYEPEKLHEVVGWFTPHFPGGQVLISAEGFSPEIPV